MSAITIENDLVHYEVLGRGRPVILLHGWLGSWRYWVPAMQALSSKYRAYSLDLWGYGDSGKEPRRFDFASQVVLLDQFMEKMGIGKAALIGHDLGAAVVARYAAQHPDAVPRMMVVSPPVFKMAPSAQSVTVSASSNRQIATTAGNASEKTAALPAGDAKPAGAGNSTPAADGGNPRADVQTEAETMPWRTEEMRARIRAALDKQAQQLGESLLDTGAHPVPPSPKSPQAAATPPTDKPATEIASTPPAAGDKTPATPVPAAKDSGSSPSAVATTGAAASAPVSGVVQDANPLKEQLEIDTLKKAVDAAGKKDVTLATELLKKHVDDGPDRTKLLAEVQKAHASVVEICVNSFAGVDTLRELIAVPTSVVAVCGASDTFLPPPNEAMREELKSSAGKFHYIELQNAAHFPMLEDIAGFTRLLQDFLEVPDVTKLEVKKIWERRVR